MGGSGSKQESQGDPRISNAEIERNIRALFESSYKNNQYAPDSANTLDMMETPLSPNMIGGNRFQQFEDQLHEYMEGGADTMNQAMTETPATAIHNEPNLLQFLKENGIIQHRQRNDTVLDDVKQDLQMGGKKPPTKSTKPKPKKTEPEPEAEAEPEAEPEPEPEAEPDVEQASESEPEPEVEPESDSGEPNEEEAGVGVAYETSSSSPTPDVHHSYSHSSSEGVKYSPFHSESGTENQTNQRNWYDE